MFPKTLSEWVQYVANLDSKDLIIQAGMAGEKCFVDSLMDEGYTPEDIDKIHLAFALRFKQDKKRIPAYEGTVVDYRAILNPSKI
jgi:hypothetical protein